MSARLFLLLTLLAAGAPAAAQQRPKLAFYTPRLTEKDPRPFVVNCLCGPHRDELMPDQEGPPDSLGQVRAVVRIYPLFKFAPPCDGVYYYQLLSEQWVKPTFRPGFSYYNYVVILDRKPVAFHSNDPANPAKFARIQRRLRKNLGTIKTDSLKPLLLLGYKKV